MNDWQIGELLENTTPHQWFIYGAMLFIVACALLRTAGNIWEMRRLNKLGKRRGEYYARRVWRASTVPLKMFLAVECLVVNVLCALVLLVLCDVTLW